MRTVLSGRHAVFMHAPSSLVRWNHARENNGFEGFRKTSHLFLTSIAMVSCNQAPGCHANFTYGLLKKNSCIRRSFHIHGSNCTCFIDCYTSVMIKNAHISAFSRDIWSIIYAKCGRQKDKYRNNTIVHALSCEQNMMPMLWTPIHPQQVTCLVICTDIDTHKHLISLPST